MNFQSDNVSGMAPEILKAVIAANAGEAPSYGADPWTAALTARLAAVFEREVAVFPVATGSAANALALACLVPPYGAVYSHEAAHIQADECGGPEFYTHGAKLVGLPGAHGRLDPDTLDRALSRAGTGIVHRVQPRALSLTQATEAGTVYPPDQIAARPMITG
jgi:threonine aldolase